MFDGTISYEGSEPSREVIDQAKRHAIDLRNMKTTAGLSQASRSFELSDGTQVYVVDLHHVWKVHIVSPSVYQPAEVVPPDPPPQYLGKNMAIAGFISGVGGVNTIETKATPWGYDLERGSPGVPAETDDRITRDGFALTRESAELFPQPEASYKLAVDIYHTHSVLGDMERRNQFHQIVPGKYTGAMAPMVQLLLGVARQVDPDYEERWCEANDEEILYIPSELNWYSGGDYGPSHGGHSVVTTGTDVSGYLNKENDPSFDTIFKAGKKIQVSYDYRSNRTHGILWGQGNDGSQKPILVEVGQRGAHVMPFPVDPLSTKPEVQEQYLKVYPALAKYAPFKGRTQTLFEAFGGFPTGENFPGSQKEFDRWKRAGRVIGDPEAVDLFYGDGALQMCTGFGWAFHPSLPRAVNTGYRYKGLRREGYAHEVRFTIIEKPENAKVRNPYLSQTIAALGLTEEIDIYKAERLPDDVAEGLIGSGDYEAFDAYEVQPDWTVSAQVVVLKQGFIDYPYNQCPKFEPCKIIGSPHFKFYEPLLGKVVHFDFQSDLEDTDESDGPIFATYLDSGIEILYYSYEEREYEGQGAYNTRQRCQYTGEWEIGSGGEIESVEGYFYCTSKDFRKKITMDQTIKTKYEGHRTGHADFVAFCHVFATTATLQRHYFGYNEYEGSSFESQMHVASVICSATNRSAFYVCMEDQKHGKNEWTGQTQPGVIGKSGWVDYGNIYHFVWHWVGCYPYTCPSIDPNVWRVCYSEIADPESCFGTDPPSHLNYVVKGGYSGIPFTLISPSDAVYGSAYYNPINPNMGPPAWAESGQNSVSEYEWEVWAFGLDLMHNRKIDSGKEVIEKYEEKPIRASDTSWWRCALDDCVVLPWDTAYNYYGKPYVKTYDSIGHYGMVDSGAKPRIEMGPASIPFGVVE